MNPGDVEQNSPGRNVEQEARAVADAIIAEIRANYQVRFNDLRNVTNDDERIRLRAQLAREAQAELGTKLRDQLAADAATSGGPETPEQKQERAKKSKTIFLTVKELNNEGIDVVDRKSQMIVDKIVEKIKTGEITDQGAVDIEHNIGKQLLEGVVFSQPNSQLSSFEIGYNNLYQVNSQAATLIRANIEANPETYGTTSENLRQKLTGSTSSGENSTNLRNRQESQQIDYSGNPAIQAEMLESGFDHALMYFQGRFTGDQMKIIQTFYSPTAFVEYMEDLSNGSIDKPGFDSPDQVLHKKEEIEHHIEEYYHANNKQFEPGNSLEQEVEKHWGETVSEEMAWRVSNVVNQLFLELQQKSPHKFYEEIMQEDPFYGPGAIQKRIQSAVNALMTKVGQIETRNDQNDPLYQRLKKLKLYRHAVAKPEVDERNGKTYPRLKPLPFGEIISTSDFIQHIGMTIDHTIHKAEYFHNSRAIYGHPAGEKGFYSHLGSFAENMRGTDIDEILLLPDGQYIMQAFQLYEKMLEEDFASLDWRHRPDQFQNQLERVNSKLEIEIFDQLRAFYPGLTKERVKNIVNSAVGISRGMFLTEPEKSAYADPVDANGEGMVASYSTNDAASLNVFNPLHTALRWQGEHNWNMVYFMPVDGQPGSWNHKKAWNNMARYMDSFTVGKGRKKEGKDKLPEVFADIMMDINNVGGPGKRKGWRAKYSLEGHFIYDDDGSINAPKTFRAMEAIGYEAIYNFYTNDQAGKDLLKATNTNPAQIAERKDLFRYIFKRYFIDDPNNFQESDLDNYLAKLQIKGKERLLGKIKNNKPVESQGGFNKKTGKYDSSINATFDEMVAYETSRLFMENTLSHYVASRFPTKFLRIDRNRFNEDGVSRWEKTYREMHNTKGWSREKFDTVMKDVTMAEMLLRRQISEQIRSNITLDQKWSLSMTDQMHDLPFKLNEAKIRELLAKKYQSDENFKKDNEVNDAVELWRHISDDLLKPDPKNNNETFLDSKAAGEINDYTFTFGLEDTDISLISYRATGPRMIARAIKDTGLIESTVTPWITQMPRILNEIAISGKHDFSPVIEYLRKAQLAIFDVHGTDAAQKFVYQMAGSVINYFKKDGMAKPLFGLLRIGQKNSIAAEYAGRSSAVWEWDSRDIDRFAVALESYRLLPLNPYDLQKVEGGEFVGGKLEDRWIKIPGIKKPIKFNLFGKKRHVDWEWNAAKLRKAHGGDRKAIIWDYVNQFLPLAMAFLLWKYIKDAIDEVEGKKK